MRISNEDSSVSFKLCLKSWECCHDDSSSPPLSSATTMNSEEPSRVWNDCILPSEGSNTGGEVSRSCHTILFVFYQSICYIPPENSVELCPACKCQQTFPEWKVWLLAMIETDFIVIPAGAKSNFQLILPIEEPSVRAMYTCRKKYNQVITPTAACCSWSLKRWLAFPTFPYYLTSL